jgi:hypothetical protein
MIGNPSIVSFLSYFTIFAYILATSSRDLPWQWCQNVVYKNMQQQPKNTNKVMDSFWGRFKLARVLNN